MALDSRFICSGDIESFFVDKTTALPLAAGVINFYVDGTNTPKSVYMLTGTPGTYAYVSLGTSLTLNAAGEYQSGGNPIVIYYFPFHCTVDGDPSTSTGVQELYSSAVFNAGGTQQYTRNAWPPLATNLTPSNNAVDVINYIPNGQFLYYNSNPISTTVTNTLHTNTAKQIAQGGWTFQQTSGSTGSYTISFTQAANGIAGILDFPINLVNVVCNTAGNETVHDLVISWPNANTFSKQGGTNSFNLLFAANSVPATTVNFGLYLTTYYGTGGSATTETLIETIPITTGFTYYNTQIDFPDNSAKTVGAGSYIALSLRTPTGQTCNVQFTDAALIQGTTALSNFPVTSNAQMLEEGIAGWMPTPDPAGNDLYLPLRLTPEGMEFDHSVVGTIVAKPQLVAEVGELLMNGSTYVRSAYSADGIPYQRLADYLITNSNSYTSGGSTIPSGNIPLFGTGANFVSIWTTATPGEFIVNFNTASGSNSVTVATASPTGFTLGVAADPLHPVSIPGVPAASTFFSFSPNNGGALVYNVWFSVDGAGTAPATPTGANIQVALVTGDTVATTRLKIQAAINKHQFAVVDMRGYFLRGLGGVDPDSATRSSQIVYNGAAIAGAYLGSSQVSTFSSHTHPGSTIDAVDGAGGAAAAVRQAGVLGAQVAALTIAAQGGSENRPVSIAVNYFIKY